MSAYSKCQVINYFALVSLFNLIYFLRKIIIDDYNIQEKKEVFHFLEGQKYAVNNQSFKISLINIFIINIS